MTVKQLRKLLKRYDKDATVVVVTLSPTGVSEQRVNILGVEGTHRPQGYTNAAPLVGILTKALP